MLPTERLIFKYCEAGGENTKEEAYFYWLIWQHGFFVTVSTSWCCVENTKVRVLFAISAEGQQVSAPVDNELHIHIRQWSSALIH